MDKQLSELKQQAEQKPGDAHAVHQLADAYEQMGWRFRDKTIQEWATLLQGEGWRPSSNAGDALSQIGIGAVPALIEVLKQPFEISNHGSKTQKVISCYKITGQNMLP